MFLESTEGPCNKTQVFLCVFVFSRPKSLRSKTYIFLCVFEALFSEKTCFRGFLCLGHFCVTASKMLRFVHVFVCVCGVFEARTPCGARVASAKPTGQRLNIYIYIYICVCLYVIATGG